MTNGETRRFVLVDRDGTLIVDKVYLADPDGIAFLPGVVDGLRALGAAGFGIVVVTNQSGVGRGYFGEEAVIAVHRRLAALLRAEGVVLDGIYHCPHAPEAGCDCRKPGTALIRRAARELGFDPAGNVFIGDGAADMGAAAASGMIGIQLCAPGQAPAPGAARAANFAEAVAMVLARSGAREYAA